MNRRAFDNLERVMREYLIPVPLGHGQDKLRDIKNTVENHPMPDELRERLRNLIKCV
jgi:hypothetical protein